MTNKTGKIMALLLLASLLLTACGGGEADGGSVRLRKTEGDVWVSDEKGKDVAPEDGLALGSGWRVDTWEESGAWINLDETKEIRVDADSQVELSVDGKNIEISVKSGGLFFRVTEPLGEDESLLFRTPELTAEVRGTCGWLEMGNGTAWTLCLLEGKVRCEAVNGEKVTVTAGEKAFQTEDSPAAVVPLTAQDIPEFVREEIESDKELAKWLETAGSPDAGDAGEPEGGDVPQPDEEPLTVEPWQEAYAALLADIYAQNTGKTFMDFTDMDATSYQLYDIDKDGVPELMVEYGTSEASRRTHIYTYLDGGVMELTDREDGTFMSHSYFYTWPGENGMLEYGGHMGAAWASRVQLVNGQLSWESILDEYFENPEEDSYTDIETIAPGTRSVDSFRIGLDLPVYRYWQTGQDLKNRTVQRINADNKAVKTKLLDIIQNNGTVHASVADAYANGTGVMTFQDYLSPGVADKYSDYPLLVQRYAWVDVNGDGQVECVLDLVRDARESYESGTRAVLSLQGEEAYLYGLSYHSGIVLSDGVLVNTSLSDPSAWTSGERLMFEGDACYRYTVEPDRSVREASWETLAG